MKISVPDCGKIGVIKDLSAHELPIGAWTDASNIRFLDGYAYQFFGHSEAYTSPAFAPQYVMPVNVAGVRYWLLATAAKQYVVTNASGSTVYTDVTHATPRTGVVNQWTGMVFGGIPILNVGDTTRIPMYWDQNLANNFVDLTNWTAGMYCKSLRQFKNFLIALNVTKSGTSYPYMVKWSSPAVPGALPATWDETDATNDAGEVDVGDGQDPIIDGLQLKNSFIVYKETSTHALDYVGGPFIFNVRKVFGMSGILNKNCVVEFDSFHFVVTGSDIIIHDGYNSTSVLDKLARRSFFQGIDVATQGLVFCFKNPFLNEIFVAYPSFGATSCDTALVYNFVDKTVSYRTMPNVNHAAYGPIDSVSATWAQLTEPWSALLRAWNGPDFTPNTARVMMGSADAKMFLLDSSAAFDGAMPSAYLERRGLDFGAPERIKTITGIRPRISGNAGDTVSVKIGYSNRPDDPYADPVYTTLTYTIGTTLKCDCFVTGRYISVWFGTGTAFQFRLDSMDIFYEDAGEY